MEVGLAHWLRMYTLTRPLPDLSGGIQFNRYLSALVETRE